MKKIVFGLLFASIGTLPALAALQVGEAAPQFEARASLAGVEFDYSLAEALSEREAAVPEVVPEHSRPSKSTRRRFSI